MKHTLALSALWLLALVMAGCTYALAARLYDLEGGSPTTAIFKWTGSGQGAVTMTLPSGETCTGEYVTVPEGQTSWGQIFALGTTPAGAVTATTGSGYAVTSSNQQRGRAIGTGDRGTTIECEYVTNAYSPHGHGTCRDNRGKTYRLMF